MKVGDKVRHKKHEGIATIVDFQINQEWNFFKQKRVIKTKYIAQYENGNLLTFYGFNIGKTVFKYEPYEQLSFFDQI